jgi:hypothetical protein
MDDLEYLLSYGLLGDFGRFRAARSLNLRRGDRAVVRSHRGLEIGEVLGRASPRHAAFLPNTSVGPLLRPATTEDEATAACMKARGLGLVERGDALVRALELPLEVLDAEVLMDGARGILHHVRWADCDPRPLVSTLAREFELEIELADLSRPAPPEEHGCGSCGSESGCGSCGSGGCGSCGTADPHDVQAHFVELRQQMERRHALL